MRVALVLFSFIVPALSAQTTYYQKGPVQPVTVLGQPVSVTGSTVTSYQGGGWTVNQGSSNTISNAWPISVTQGGNTATVSSSGSLIVSGLSPVGATPALNPVSVSGVDSGGLKRQFLTDSSGRGQVNLQDSVSTNTASVNKYGAVKTIPSDSNNIVPGIGFTGLSIEKKSLDTLVFYDNFQGTALNLVNWSTSSLNGGTVAVSSTVVSFSVSGSRSDIRITSLEAVPAIGGFSNLVRMIVVVPNNPVPGNEMEWGMEDPSDINGYVFRVSSDTTFNIIIMNNGIETRISSASFLSSFTLDNKAHSYIIQYSDGNSVRFYIDNVLVYKQSSQTSPMVAVTDLNASFETENISTSTAASFKSFAVSVEREGTPLTFDSSGRLQVATSPSPLTAPYYGVDSGNVSAASAGTDNGILFVVNPSTSTKTFKLSTRMYGVAVVNIFAQFRLYSDAVVSSSGTIAKVNTLTDGVTELIPSQAQAFTLPTVVSLGNLLDTYVVPENSAAPPVQDNLIIQVAPGHNWLLTANPASNARPVDISIKWLEE